MSWFSFHDRRDEQAKAWRAIEKRRGKGEALEPVLVTSAKRNQISTTFWGHAWERHLATFSDYESRLPRGRSYLRQGSVLGLTIERGQISATVVGSSVYQTIVTLDALPAKRWKSLVSTCSGHVGSMLDLLAGKLGDETLRLLTDPENGIFPRSREMRFSCSCPDWADMCKHVAAVLYGTGIRLDHDPSLLFLLRGVESSDLMGRAAAQSLDHLAGGGAGGGELGDADLASLFGIDLGDEPPVVGEASAMDHPAKAAKKGRGRAGAKAAAKAAAKKRAKKKGRRKRPDHR